MNLQELGLVHPEWDAEISDDELTLYAKASPQDGLIHGLSPTLYQHLPSQLKGRLATQQKHIDLLVSTLHVRLTRVISADSVDGGSFYTDSAGRDIHLACKALVRADTKLKLRLSQSQRHSLIEALYTFVCRHSDPALVYNPKGLKSCIKLLSSLLHMEIRENFLKKTYDAYEAEGLVPRVTRASGPPLSLDWKPLYAFMRTIFNFDRDRRNPVHFSVSPPVGSEAVLDIIRRASHFFREDCLAELWETVFPLLSPTPPEIPVTQNPKLTDYISKLSKIEGATLAAYMLPDVLNPNVVDYHGLIDQIMDIWPIVADSNQWDRALTSMLASISKHNLIRWKPHHVRMILATTLRQLRLATAGTPFTTPSASPTPGMILGSFSLGSAPLGRLVGNLIAQILASDDVYDGKETTECSTTIFLHWLAQIEGYLHPNSRGTHVTIIKNILSGLVSDLADRMKAAIIVGDCRRFMKEARIRPHEECASQGYYDFLGLPVVYNGSLENYLIREKIWDALCPPFDRLRVHLPGTSLGNDLGFLIAHVRPSYITGSIFPRIIFALDNPMLGGRLHVPASIEILASLLPLLLSTPTCPARITELLDPLLSHIDPNDGAKTARTFEFVLALTLALTQRRTALRFKTSSSAHKAKWDAIQLPEDLSRTILAKSFNELKQRYERPATKYPYDPLMREDSTVCSQILENDDLESELLVLDSVASEWIVPFFQQTLEFVNGVPTGTSASPSLVHCIKAVLEYASESTFDLLLRKLTEAIEAVPRSKPDLNSIVDAFARVRPVQTLRACLDQWITPVKKRAAFLAKSAASDASSAAKRKPTVESEVESTTWKLDLLRLVCKRSGSCIGAHEKVLLSIVEPLLLHEDDRRIRHAALSVLPAALGPMKPTFNSLVDHFESGRIQSFSDLLLDQATFFEPNKESLDLASKWVSHFVDPIIKSIEEATALCSPAVEATSPPAFPKTLADQLRLLFEFVSALGPVVSPTNAHLQSGGDSESTLAAQALSESTGQLLKDIKIDQSVEILAPVPVPTSTSNGYTNTSGGADSLALSTPTPKPTATRLGVWTNFTKPDALPANLVSLRARVISVVQEFIKSAVLTGKCMEVKVVRRAFKVLLQALVHNGAKDTKWADKVSRLAAPSTDGMESNGGNEKSKKKQRKESSTLEQSGAVQSLPVSYPARYALSPYHPYYFHWRVAKAAAMLKGRWWSARHKLVFGPVELELFRAFVQLSMSHWEVMRSAKLLRLLLGNLPRFSGAASLLNQVLLTAISQPLAPTQPIQSLIGLVSTLSVPFAIGNLSSNWKNINEFARVWRGLHIHDNALAQMSILGVFAFLISRTNIMPASPQQDSAQFKAYTELMNSSLAELSATRPEAHWRYFMFPLILLCSFLRKNIHTPRNPKVIGEDVEQRNGALIDTAVDDNNPGLDGMRLLRIILPIQLDVLPAARSISRWAVTKLLTWAQQSGDTSHTQIVTSFLQPQNLDSLLEHISNDRQARKLSPQSMQPIVAQIIRDADPTGAIGDYELCIGADTLNFGGLSLRFADLWYRLFNSLKSQDTSDTSTHPLVLQMASYLASKLRDNLGKKTESASSKEEQKPSLEQPAESNENALSVATPPPSSSTSPGPENSDELEFYFASLSEALTGLTRAFPDVAIEHVWPTILEAPRVSSKRTSSLLLVVAYLLHYKTNLDALTDKLVKPIMEASGTTDFGSLSIFQVEFRLTLTLFAYQELGIVKIERLTDLVEHLFLKKSVASLPKPQIRTASMRLLALLTAVISRTGLMTPASQRASDVHDRCIELLLDPIDNEPQEAPANTSASVVSVATASTGSAVPVTATDRIKSTFLAWISEVLEARIGTVMSAQWWTRLTRALVELSVDSASATAKLAAKQLLILSQCVVSPPSEIEQVELIKQVENLKQLASGHTRWRARINAILFLRFFTFNHALLMPLSSRVELLDWSKHLLTDPNVDVRKGATAAISSFIRSLQVLDSNMHQLADFFLKIAADNNKRARANPRQDKNDAPTNTAETIAALITGTSGLVALTSSCPYSVPSWMPKVLIYLQYLSSHSNGAVASLASEEVSQFWKTHRDEWHFHKAHFTEDQLKILEDKPIPSYYA